ncbi:radical SAM protein [Streptomyces sp. NPDC053048]|uniref:radical SAM protein n=1 Tax=Streptomyces sp. NPDC053048 TaxID=3365694 RepID=UPI0037D6ED7C
MVARPHATPSRSRHWAFHTESLPLTGLTAYRPLGRVEVKFLDGCNRSCAFCVNEDHIGKVLNPLDTDRFNTSLHTWLESTDEQEKPFALYGTGGEPLMVLDLVDEVIRPLAGSGIATRLVTNGTLLNESRIARLVDMQLTGLKITYNTTDSARLLSMVGGSHAKDVDTVLENIRTAKAAGLWVFVRVSVGRSNDDEIKKIYDLMTGIGVDVVQLKPWIPSGLAASHPDDLALPPEQTQHFFEDFARQLRAAPTTGRPPRLTVSCYPPARSSGLTTKDCPHVEKIYCEPGGRVMVCNYADEYLGSWFPEDGGLLSVVARRRELYSRMMDDHGVTSCPARLNWSQPAGPASPPPTVPASPPDTAPLFSPQSLWRRPSQAPAPTDPSDRP